ncbi:MAG: hypothetical protein Kow0031_30920 [Anaerolineae bacterium]
MELFSNTVLVQAAANIATLLFTVMIIVQILVGAGLLPVSILWGGRQTELTPALRVASFAAVALLALFIYLIRYRAGLAGNSPVLNIIWFGAWGVTAYMALNTLGNLASVNNTEKFLFGAITFALTVTCLIVSLSPIA